MEPGAPHFRAKLALCWRVFRLSAPGYARRGMVDSNTRPWPLYPSGVAPLDRPGYFSPESVKNRPEGRVFFNVTNVTLTPYLVDRGHPLFTGASVVVAPGGAYKWLTWDAEGTDIAAWLNSIGVSAFDIFVTSRQAHFETAGHTVKAVNQSRAAPRPSFLQSRSHHSPGHHIQSCMLKLETKVFY